VLAGSITQDSGALSLDGAPCSFGRPRDARDRGIVLVSQEPTAVPRMSIAENLFLHEVRTPWQPTRRRRIAAAARPLLERVGVQADPTASFDSLGPGDRELVEIAKALASRPRLLLLDEVTSRLGRDDVARVFHLLRSLRDDEGTAVVFVTHRLREIRELADRVVVLRDGLRSGELTGAEASDAALAQAMVGRDLGDFFHKREVPLREVALSLRNLVVSDGAAPVDLDVREGEIVGLAGLVGCGRSELLETVAGARAPVSGTCEAGGRALRPGSVRDALDAGVALVPEDRHRQGLVLGATVCQNVALGSWRATAFARRRRELRDAHGAIDRLAIRAGPHTPVAALSGGNQQKVVLGRVLEHQPRVLLLDEPTRGIDVGAKAEFFELLGRLVADGAAVVLASSDLLELLGLCDRIVVLHDRAVSGELARSAATEQAIALLSAGGEVAHVGD
jgi:ABC-type sugar transport system ATPase subunit